MFVLYVLTDKERKQVDLVELDIEAHFTDGPADKS